MKKTLSEKILARAANLSEVCAGEIVDVFVDRLMINDYVGPNVRQAFSEVGGSVVSPERVLVCFDHSAPPASIAAADNLREMRLFCKRHGITKVAEIGRHGIGHQLMLENFVQPGELAVGTDSHSTMYGGLSSFGCGITASDAVVALRTGHLWLKVPETIRLQISGKTRYGVTGKDIALYMIDRLHGYDCNYKAIEIGGPGLCNVSMESRFTIANLLAETDAKNVLFEADASTAAYAGIDAGTMLQPDADAAYEATFAVELSDIAPLAACPHAIGNIKRVQDEENVRVDQVFIGSCTNGRMEDLRQAAEVLSGRTVAPSVRLIVVPASQSILQQAVAEGVVAQLLAAGAAILTPGCASCAGSGAGMLAAGEVCVSTTNRNFKGRMGSADSKVYLASAYTAAATAVTGYLCVADAFLQGEGARHEQQN